MSFLGNTDELVGEFVAAKLSWDQIKEAMEKRMGQSGFTIFSKVEQGELLAFAGKSVRACQYAVGSPLLAIAMIEHVPSLQTKYLLDRTGERHCWQLRTAVRA